MKQSRITGKGFKRLKFFNRTALVAIAAVALGLWIPNTATATLIGEIEPNNTGATAQNNLNGFFSLDFVTNINNSANANTSTTIPHVSIRATGDGTFDFYRFTSLGGTLILDIDSTTPGGIGSDHDTEIGLWTSAGNLLAFNDDQLNFDTGSALGTDSFCISNNCNSFIQTAVAAGDYIVGVCRFNCGFSNGFNISGAALSQGPYTLHISTPHYAGTYPTPEPSAMILLGSGLAGLGAYSRRRNAKRS